MSAVLRYAGVSLLLVVAIGWLLGLAFDGPGERRAIWVSAAVALVVQIVTFAVVRLSRTTNLWAGWGVGAAIRFLTLVVYAFLMLEAFALPMAAALISLATFLFVSTLVEPLLLGS